MDENDEGSRFCEEDIDQILQRRATTITIESEGKGSTFSKASFVASENRNDIALDDPEFWQKWAKKADIDMDSINRKVSRRCHPEPRVPACIWSACVMLENWRSS